MRKSHSTQPRLDCTPVEQVVLNLQCRDEIIPILYALQHIYLNRSVRDAILQLIAQDVNPKSDSQRGRPDLYYRRILVLAAVRLGCNFEPGKAGHDKRQPERGMEATHAAEAHLAAGNSRD